AERPGQGSEQAEEDAQDEGWIEDVFQVLVKDDAHPAESDEHTYPGERRDALLFPEGEDDDQPKRKDRPEDGAEAGGGQLDAPRRQAVAHHEVEEGQQENRIPLALAREAVALDEEPADIGEAS